MSTDVIYLIVTYILITIILAWSVVEGRLPEKSFESHEEFLRNERQAYRWAWLSPLWPIGAIYLLLVGVFLVITGSANAVVSLVKSFKKAWGPLTDTEDGYVRSEETNFKLDTQAQTR